MKCTTVATLICALAPAILAIPVKGRPEDMNLGAWKAEKGDEDINFGNWKRENKGKPEDINFGNWKRENKGKPEDMNLGNWKEEHEHEDAVLGKW